MRAIRDYKDCKLSQNSAFKSHIRRTVRLHIVNNKACKLLLDRKPVLPIDEENDLFTRNFKLVGDGYPVMSKIIKICILKFCSENEITHNLSIKKASR